MAQVVERLTSKHEALSSNPYDAIALGVELQRALWSLDFSQ
jgi:hypothetical protein